MYKKLTLLLFILLQNSNSIYNLSKNNNIINFKSHNSISSLTITHNKTPKLLISLYYQSLTNHLTIKILKTNNLHNISIQHTPNIINFIILLY